MKRLLFVVLVLVTAAVAKAETPKSATLKPNKIVEKCMSLVPPQKIEYRFESSAKLNFNLHYHKGEQVYYPVKLDRTNGESGLYEVKAKEVATKPLGEPPAGSDLAELAAWTLVGNVLLNLDEILMKR